METCETGADGEEHIRAGKLNLVDLAGSERQAKTGAEGKANDSDNILILLGIPYRNSSVSFFLKRFFP